METIEIWLPIEKHPNYEVSNKGWVRNVKTGKTLSREITHSGLARVTFDGKHYYIHRLVADTFYTGNAEGLCF